MSIQFQHFFLLSLNQHYIEPLATLFSRYLHYPMENSWWKSHSKSHVPAVTADRLLSASSGSSGGTSVSRSSLWSWWGPKRSKSGRFHHSVSERTWMPQLESAASETDSSAASATLIDPDGAMGGCRKHNKNTVSGNRPVMLDNWFKRKWRKVETLTWLAVVLCCDTFFEPKDCACLLVRSFLASTAA